MCVKVFLADDAAVSAKQFAHCYLTGKIFRS